MAPSGVYHACSIAQLYYEFLPSTVDFRRYNLFCDESVVQRRSWPVDYVLSLSYFSAVDVFFSDGFHCEVDWSVRDFAAAGHAGVYIGQAAHLL